VFAAGQTSIEDPAKAVKNLIVLLECA